MCISLKSITNSSLINKIYNYLNKKLTQIASTKKIKMVIISFMLQCTNPIQM